MLRRLALLWIALASTSARAEPPRDRLRLPERLTAGAADQFLGTLSPDGRRLYFVSTSNATLQVFSQDLEGGPPAALFDEAADCTLPRPSPDGKSVAYLSFREDATGDVCVRDLQTLTRRCLTDAASAEQDLLWLPDSSAVLAVSRQGLHEDVEIDKLARDGGSRQSFLFRDLASPAISPDGRWLAYVPTARDAQDVGPSFASRAVKTIALQRFDRLREKPIELRFDLPGAGGFPAFSADGKWLYFAQYLDDTDGDGVIDGRDQSTLFRVGFDSTAATPVRAADLARPIQLSSVAWNCQYPSPGALQSGRLIATCSLAGSLDVYSLPLEGALPPEWTADKLREEIAASTDRDERLLYLQRLLALVGAGEEQGTALAEILGIHLERGAFESADWTLAQLAKAGHLGKPAVALLTELIAHRRAERALDRGQLSASFIADTRDRLRRVRQLNGEGERMLRALLEVELLDVLGEKRAAVAVLTAVDFSRAASPLALHLIASRAADLYTQLDRRATLLEVDRALSAHPSLSERERLAYAERYVETLLRGAPRARHDELLDDAVRRAPPDGELAIRLRLEQILDDIVPGIDDPGVERVRAAAFDLYRRAESFERRRMIVHVTVSRAGQLGSERILYDLANAWVSLMTRGTTERRYAERLYRDVVLERAYLELRGGKLADARGRFYGVTLQTDSLEAWTGFLGLRAQDAPDKVQQELAARRPAGPDDPVLRYGKGLLALRDLGKLPDDAARIGRLDGALGHLKVAGRSLARSTELNYLWGHALYLRYRLTGDNALAQEANTRLLLSADLAVDNLRYRAVDLETLARLQATVGNHRIALGHFTARDALPFAAPEAELSHLLFEARSHQLVDHEREAIAVIERALTLAGSQPSLARYLPLVLDRAALHHLAAGEAAPAVKRFDQLLALLPKAELTPRERERDRFTALLGRGAALLADARAADALRDLAEAEAMLDKAPLLASAPSRRATDLPADRDGPRTYRLLLSGLRAEGHARLSQLEQAAVQQRRRRDLLTARSQQFAADEDLLALGEAEAHLGAYAAAQKRWDEAVKHYEAGLAAAERFSDKTGTLVHPLRVALLADLVTLRYVDSRRRGGLDLAKKIVALLDVYARQRNPAYAAACARLERDLTRLTLERNDPR